MSSNAGSNFDFDFNRPRQFLRTAKGALLAIFVGLFALGATAVGWPVAVPHMLAAVLELFRTPFVQATLFLALFMLTDPPTAPSRYTDQVGIGVLVAVASVAAKMLGAGQTYLLAGLLVGNVALAVRRWLSQRRQVRQRSTSSTRRLALAA